MMEYLETDSYAAIRLSPQVVHNVPILMDGEGNMFISRYGIIGPLVMTEFTRIEKLPKYRSQRDTI